MHVYSKIRSNASTIECSFLFVDVPPLVLGVVLESDLLEEVVRLLRTATAVLVRDRLDLLVLDLVQQRSEDRPRRPEFIVCRFPKSTISNKEGPTYKQVTECLNITLCENVQQNKRHKREACVRTQRKKQRRRGKPTRLPRTNAACEPRRTSKSNLVYASNMTASANFDL